MHSQCLYHTTSSNPTYSFGLGLPSQRDEVALELTSCFQCVVLSRMDTRDGARVGLTPARSGPPRRISLIMAPNRPLWTERGVDLVRDWRLLHCWAWHWSPGPEPPSDNPDLPPPGNRGPISKVPPTVTDIPGSVISS